MFESWKKFLKALWVNPGFTGAACPSSRGLTRQMASYVDPSGDGWVVELGAGTGVVTEALLERGVSPARLVVVEFDAPMAAFLKGRFPGVHVIEGDAALLGDHLEKLPGNKDRRVDYVVSSLPLRSLPSPVVQAILAQMKKLLGKDGKYIQFTYDIRPGTACWLEGFGRKKTRVIWWNFPPARADLFVSCP